MIHQNGNLWKTSHDAKPASKEQIACVRTGNYGIVQGTLLWEQDGVACIQVFSQQYTGARI